MVASRSRREFLSRMTVAAGTFALAGTPLLAAAGDNDETHVWRGRRHRVKTGRRFFPQSVASFDPRADSVVLWARVEDDDHKDQDLPLILLVATDAWLQHLVVAVDLTAHAADDGVAQVKLAGLKARTRYYRRSPRSRSARACGLSCSRTRPCRRCRG